MEMVEVKTSEMIGAALDWAIAQIEKPSNLFCLNSFDGGPRTRGNIPHYSTCWTHGGPLLDKYDVALNGGVAESERVIYGACRDVENEQPYATAVGDIRLTAACRSIVSAKLGDTVQIPAELVNIK